MIYFLHIPKTSGSAIEASISFCRKWPENYIFSDKTPEPNNRDEVLKFFNDENFKNYTFIKGHFACMPYLYADNIQAFSLIREPLERSISYFKYVNAAKDITYPESFYWYLDQDPNIQSAYFTDFLKWKEPIENEKYRDAYLDSPQMSFDELLLNIKQKNITISTVKNRNYLLKQMQIAFSILLGEEIYLDPDFELPSGYKVQYNPFTMDLSCLTEDIKEKFKSKNSLDYQLFNYVSAHEAETGRSLTPSDIAF